MAASTSGGRNNAEEWGDRTAGDEISVFSLPMQLGACLPTAPMLLPGSRTIPIHFQQYKNVHDISI